MRRWPVFDRRLGRRHYPAPPPSRPGRSAPRTGKLRSAHFRTSGSHSTVNPALVERGLQGYADTQNALAQALRQVGIDLRSRLPHEPNFDLAWEANGRVFVAEIKSITRR